MASVTIVNGVCTISAGDATADYATLINNALDNPAVHTVQVQAGEYLLHAPIFIGSEKTILGAGRDQTFIRVAPDFTRPNPGEADGILNTDFDATGVTLADFSLDGAKLMPGGFRLVGCFMHEATGFDIDRVDIYNTTGYGHFAQGDANAFTDYASGTYDDCAVYNAQIAFEQMAADGVTLTNCFAGDGDGDLVGTYFHPLTGSRNITYIDCTAIGFANVGFELTANVRPMDNIVIIDSSVTMLGVGAAFVAAGGVTTNLQIEGSTFIAYGNSAALIYGAQGTATDSYFQGQRIAVVFNADSGGTPSNFTITDSDALSIADLAEGGAAFGVGGSGTIHWNGGSIEARAFGAAMIPLGSSAIIVSGTQLIAQGYEAGLQYTRNAGEMLLAPLVDVHAETLGSLSGGSMTVSYVAYGEATDALRIRNVGSGAGQIGVSGANVTYGGAVIGTFSGGTGGTPLVVQFGAGATADAAEALVRALTYSNTASGLEFARDIKVLIEDGPGATLEANLAVLLSDNQAPYVVVPAAPPLAYVENDPARILVSVASVTDLDSANFAGGTLRVAFTQGGSAADRLTVLSQGSGAQAVLVTGSEVRYGGVLVGTIAGGTSGSAPLVITFNTSANAAASAAIIKAVAYANVSEEPSTVQRILSMTLTDGDGAAGLPLQLRINVTAVDDPMNLVGGAGNDVFAGASLTDNLYGQGGDDSLDGFGGADLLVGGIGNDRLTGGTGNDTLYGEDGDDQLIGQENDDVIDGGRGRDTIYGGSGADYLIGGADNDILNGAEDNDLLLGQDGDDNIDAGSGNDTLHGGLGRDVLAGGIGNDIFYGNEGDDLLLGQDGDDNLDGGTGADTLYGDAGKDYMVGGADADILYGQDGADYLLGGDGDDKLDGGAGIDVLYGAAGADLILGGADADRLFGEAGIDNLLGQEGDDQIDGGAGADWLYGGDGVDYLLGGIDNDRLFGEAGSDQLLGDEGDDTLDGGAGADALYGGNGLDYLIGGLEGDRLYGDAGNDTLLGQDGDDTLDGGLDDDSLYGGGGNDFLTGGLGLDRLYGEDGTDTLTGLDGNDVLDGGAGADSLFGGNGLDSLSGGLDGDRLYGEAGNDTLFGQDGDDTLDGGLDDDTLYGGGGGDFLTGGLGLDRLYGEDGNDTLTGLDGDDLLDGGAGTDTLRGGIGQDFMSGGADDDKLYGEADIDRLFGDAGNDLIDGGEGNDSLAGGDGSDVLIGGAGADLLDGGAGADTMLFLAAGDSAGTATDLVTLFETGIDHLDLSQIDANSTTGNNDAFTFLGAGAFTGQAGQLRAYAGGGAWIVEGDLNGDSVADFLVTVTTVNNQALTLTDIFL